MKRIALTACAAAALATAFMSGMAAAEDQPTDAGKLARDVQNPIAAVISVPFQNNSFFGIGPHDDAANVLNIQPVIPVNFGEWNVINRTILPLIYFPESTAGTENVPQSVNHTGAVGLGDINYTGFISPARPGPVIWGVGPSFSLPTATDSKLGSQKWSAGPSAVALMTPNPWVVGVLARQLWSFAGNDDRQAVNQSLVQPFVNYNLPEGWYLTSAPIMTANWEASGEKWLVPVGGGFGKVFHVGKQPISSSLQSYYNAVRPDQGPEWSVRFVVQLLFPK